MTLAREETIPQKYPCVRHAIRNTPSTKIMGVTDGIRNHWSSARFRANAVTRMTAA